MRCVLVPRGCSSKLKFAEFRIFETLSFIGIADVITIFVVYMDLILLCSDHMHDVYKSYYRLLSRLVRKFIAPVQKIANVEPLYWRITEFRALTEGLFPIGCMSYMLHSLQCIAKHIFEKGPISSFGALRGECNIAKVKRQVNTSGGLNIQLSAYKKYYNKEVAITTQFYGNLESKKDCAFDQLLDINEITGEIIYQFEKCSIKVSDNKNLLRV